MESVEKIKDMDTVIQTEKLYFGYNGKNVLQDISVSVEKSDFLGIAGPNGSGKTTFLKIISGILRPHTGSIFIDKKSPAEYSKSELAKVISYVPSEIFVPFNFSVLEIVLMGRSPHLKWWQDYSEKDMEIAQGILSKMAIARLGDRFVHSLSSGEKQLVFIAQAMAQQSNVLMLDEPTSHLDINYRIEIFDLLSRIRTENDLTVLVVSHDLSLLKKYCSKIMIFKEGTLFLSGQPHSVFTEQNLRNAYNIKIPFKIDEII